MIMTDKDVYCLNCGYCLRGIPERRCPECGSGYDHAAIRYFSFHQNWDRRDAARHVISSSAIGMAILVSPLMWDFNWGPFGRVALVYAAWLTAILIVRLMNPRDPEGLILTASPVELTLKFIWLTPIPAIFLSALPVLGLVSGTIVCVRAWIIYARAPERFAFAYRMEEVERQRSLHVYVGIATGALVLMTILVMVGWFG